jgi:co-chaperonin GroES (HSP10)
MDGLTCITMDGMRISDIRLLGDQVLVKCLGTANMQGRIHIPMSAQQARQIHQSGGDYVHRGEVLAVGPGDRMDWFWCRASEEVTPRLVDSIFKIVGGDTKQVVASNPKCHTCGGKLTRRNLAPSRSPMPVKVGDVVLYERRRDAVLQIQRFPSLDLEDDMLVILLAEQHVLAVLESEAKAA